jgi:hypothetical protein
MCNVKICSPLKFYDSVNNNLKKLQCECPENFMGPICETEKKVRKIIN